VPGGLSVVLASASPRRRELLSVVLPHFEVVIPRHEIPPQKGESAHEYALTAARGKCREVFRERPHSLVIGADTVVVVDNSILGKPQDEREAERMLKTLSNREHQVITGVWVCAPHREEGFTEVSLVRFGELEQDEIRRYVASKEPMDKAGAYGIQGMASCFVEGIKGSYTNVVGLPVRRLYLLLKKLFATWPQEI